ncbi:MAG: hypothetical protein HDT18_01655 [Oscillibacter sp.]|nr:hypothetical protein [Oscillibacter sp.]
MPDRTEYSLPRFLKSGGFNMEKNGIPCRQRKKTDPAGKSLRGLADISSFVM